MNTKTIRVNVADLEALKEVYPDRRGMIVEIFHEMVTHLTEKKDDTDLGSTVGQSPDTILNSPELLAEVTGIREQLEILTETMNDLVVVVSKIRKPLQFYIISKAERRPAEQGKVFCLFGKDRGAKGKEAAGG